MSNVRNEQPRLQQQQLAELSLTSPDRPMTTTAAPLVSASSNYRPVLFDGTSDNDGDDDDEAFVLDLDRSNEDSMRMVAMRGAGSKSNASGGNNSSSMYGAPRRNDSVTIGITSSSATSSPSGYDANAADRLRPTNSRWRYVYWTQPKRQFLECWQSPRKRWVLVLGIAAGLVLLWLLVFAATPATTVIGKPPPEQRDNSTQATIEKYYDAMQGLRTLSFEDAVYGRYTGQLPSYQWTKWRSPSTPNMELDGAFLTVESGGGIAVRSIAGEWGPVVVVPPGAMRKVYCSLFYHFEIISILFST
jgi:hypothetical protein